MSWLLSVTERVHQMREQQALTYATPQWVNGVDLCPPIDRELLRLRGRYAYAIPGVEIR